VRELEFEPPKSFPESFEFEYYDVITTKDYSMRESIHYDGGKKYKIRYSLPLKMIYYSEEIY
jgi:hypothetical protein